MPATTPSPTFLGKISDPIVRLQHAFVDLLNPRRRRPSSSPELEEILVHCQLRTDISDHLPLLFAEALSAKPRLIVELGVRGGESTFVLEKIARSCGAHLVSVDIEDCSEVCNYPKWIFVKSDDIEFAKAFPNWCAARQIQPSIDFLFIDTSHLFEHTMQEINHWFPLLSEHAKVCFHDTNQKKIYIRRDGSIGVGWTDRGVIGALEKHFGKSFNEKQDFIDLAGGWLINHHANCNGFTVLTRIS